MLNDLDAEIQYVIQFAGDTKLGRVTSTLEGRNKILKDLDKLEKGVTNNKKIGVGGKISKNNGKCCI